MDQTSETIVRIKVGDKLLPKEAYFLDVAAGVLFHEDGGKESQVIDWFWRFVICSGVRRKACNALAQDLTNKFIERLEVASRAKVQQMLNRTTWYKGADPLVFKKQINSALETIASVEGETIRWEGFDEVFAKDDELTD